MQKKTVIGVAVILIVGCAFSLAIVFSKLNSEAHAKQAYEQSKIQVKPLDILYYDHADECHFLTQGTSEGDNKIRLISYTGCFGRELYTIYKDAVGATVSLPTRLPARISTFTGTVTVTELAELPPRFRK